MPQVAGFLVIFALLFGLQEINPLMLISWFFVFVMLIEPKTSGYGNLPGFVFGGIAGVSAYLIYSYFGRYDLFVSSLLVANLSRPWLEKLLAKLSWLKRRKKC